jgi:hypothetical protein
MPFRANHVFVGRLFGPDSDSPQSEILGLLVMGGFMAAMIYFITSAA